ncbi:MAG: redox-sensing transcriptional repressor Rex [Acidimicrobiia bacterium]
MRRWKRAAVSSAAMRGLSRATVARLPRYLRLLDEVEGDRATVSSDDLAGAAGVNPANVRRDLSALGFQGTRGVGYSVAPLRDRIRRELGIDSRRRVAIVGAGNLGTALARYTGLGKRGFDVVAIYDVDRRRIGEAVGDLTVDSLSRIGDDCAAGRFEMAILAVPASAAQQVADLLGQSGVSSILNFAPVRVSVRDGVAIRHVDLSVELQILSYYG